MPQDDETARFPTVPDTPARDAPPVDGAPTARTAEEQPTGPVRVSALSRRAQAP